MLITHYQQGFVFTEIPGAVQMHANTLLLVVDDVGEVSASWKGPGYDTLSQKAERFLAMTGYTVEEFDSLLPAFESEFVDCHLVRLLASCFVRCRVVHVEYKGPDLTV